eukprot:s3232_g3.t1
MSLLAEADDSLNITLKTEVSGVTDCSDKPELKASFLKKFSLAMKTIPPERLVRLRQLGSQLSLATVTGITCSEVSPHSDGLMAWASRWSRHTVIVLAAVICIATLCCCCSLFGHRGYQRVTGAPDTRTVRQGAAQPPRFESRSARMERVKSRVEKYSQRALDLVMAAEPDFEDTELQYYVKILNRCRGHAKSVCGSPWSEWQTSGDCELCKRRIDRPEKGLQCTQGGHRLCFRCIPACSADQHHELGDFGSPRGAKLVDMGPQRLVITAAVCKQPWRKQREPALLQGSRCLRYGYVFPQEISISYGC